ncbi:M48 family metalloprotease [Candidatus Dependentiae bacterium]|nr:M48 family metalloprotease [Candidatus Dependentiae bacterium]
MKVKLQFASLMTLSFLFGLVLVIILAASYFAGKISWQFMIGITILSNVLTWLLGPYISDIIYKIFYKIKFYNYEEIKQYPYAQFIKKVCDKHNIKTPKIGIINDQNPTAFTYGSASFNARVVVTEGLFKFLNEQELNAVVAHELGHIVNKDFIVMSIASTLLSILYELYVIFTETRNRSSSSSSSSENGKSYFFFIGLVSLIFYWIGTYFVLYLSRLREYYADEFSAKETGDPNILSSALIKVAYGIASVPDTEKTAHLLNTTRAQGIFDFKAAKNIGLIYENDKERKGLLERSLLFDIVNPWAWIYQLKSTHPLIGKRIKRLCSLTTSPIYDFENIINSEVDKEKLWSNFFKDILVMYSQLIVIIVTILAVIPQAFTSINFIVPTIIAGLVLLIIVSIIKLRYKFPIGDFKEATILEYLADIYASPIKGKPIKIEGQAIGRGEAGFIFGEDMLFQDKSGFIYLNYESAIPIFGNLFFAWKKLDALLKVPATSTGWFLRGNAFHLELYRFETKSQTIKSYVRFWELAGLSALVLICSISIYILAFYKG